MSLNTKLDIWTTLAKEKYPDLLEHQLQVMSMLAASSWYAGEENEYSELFDQYVMLKNLKGNQDGESSN